MIKLCQSCGEDFFIKEIELITSDQLIECKNCGKNNLVESLSSDLEKKLFNLDQELNNTEQELNLQNSSNIAEIEKLQMNLVLKKMN